MPAIWFFTGYAVGGWLTYKLRSPQSSKPPYFLRATPSCSEGRTEPCVVEGSRTKGTNGYQPFSGWPGTRFGRVLALPHAFPASLGAPIWLADTLGGGFEAGTRRGSSSTRGTTREARVGRAFCIWKSVQPSVRGKSPARVPAAGLGIRSS
jgi:hypothetical protein